MRHRPWNPLGRDDSFYTHAAYVVVDAISVNEDDVPYARLVISPWPRICSVGHLHFPEESVTVLAEVSVLATFFGRHLPSFRLREGAVFYASRTAHTVREGETLMSPSTLFMRPLLDVSEEARGAAAAAMYSAIQSRNAEVSACDWKV